MINDYQVLYLTELMEKIADAVIPAEKRHECPLCKSKVNVFLPFGVNPRPNAKCPVCGALERHRALWMVCEKRQMFNQGGRVLHFAPEKALFEKFSSMNNVDYWPVDINPNMPGVRRVVDITDIPFDDDSVDMIVCNHVLEHIPDEKKAMSELYRVLSPSGFAFLNVPIMKEKTLENPEYNTPELRTKYYGGYDHLRAYGKDYPSRLEQAGFKVEIISVKNEVEEENIKHYGLLKHETFFLCRK